MTQVQDSNVSPHYILYGWNVILPPGVSQMKAFLLSVEIPLKRPPFLDISAFLSLSSGSQICHFEIFSRFPLSQVQTSPFFSKPMCHAPVVQVPRFWISRLINCHSSSVSMETKCSGTRVPPFFKSCMHRGFLLMRASFVMLLTTRSDARARKGVSFYLSACRFPVFLYTNCTSVYLVWQIHFFSDLEMYYACGFVIKAMIICSSQMDVLDFGPALAY